MDIDDVRKLKKELQAGMTDGVVAPTPQNAAALGLLRHALAVATGCGLLDEIAAEVGPDAVNEFCDAVNVKYKAGKPGFPLFATMPVGAGKTAVVREWAEANNFKLFEIPARPVTVEGLRGLPAFTDQFYCQNCRLKGEEDEFVPSDGNPAPHVCPECGSTDCFPVDPKDTK